MKTTWKRAPGTVLAALRRMRRLLADEERWCQGWDAKHVDGGPVPATSESACAWCLNGAVIRTCCGYGEDYGAVVGALREMASTSLVNFNDDPSRTHADILNLLDRAIEAQPV